MYFPKPGSFTEKEVVELHAHGGRIFICILYKELQTFIRIAEPRGIIPNFIILQMI
ncbi:hypothetical protein [Anaplasma phagocytophilum]|uniref:hypothetical protein n=1 Tax=Anaplasma phagocytophilum TaxID=948 RepID=UPI000A5C2651|nr:hypothetical protein [Anaplasma phagocytophilum]